MLDYSPLLVELPIEAATPAGSLGPVSKPVSRALDKLIAAQDGVRFAAVVASGAAAGMAVKVLRHSAEFASRVELLVLASPMQ